MYELGIIYTRNTCHNILTVIPNTFCTFAQLLQLDADKQSDAGDSHQMSLDLGWSSLWTEQQNMDHSRRNTQEYRGNNM